VRPTGLLGFSIEVNVSRGGWKLAVLRLHHGATVQSARGCRRPSLQNSVFNTFFGDVNIFSIVLSKNDNFLMFHYFYFYEIH
jgi:hypothetical protein